MVVLSLLLVLKLCQIAYTVSITENSQIQSLLLPPYNLALPDRFREPPPQNLQLSVTVEPATGPLATPCLTTITVSPVISLEAIALSPLDHSSVSLACTENVFQAEPLITMPPLTSIECIPPLIDPSLMTSFDCPVFSLPFDEDLLHIVPLKLLPRLATVDISSELTDHTNLMSFTGTDIPCVSSVTHSLPLVETTQPYKVPEETIIDRSALVPIIPNENSVIDHISFSPSDSIMQKHPQPFMYNKIFGIRPSTAQTRATTNFLANNCPINKPCNLNKENFQTQNSNKYFNARHSSTNLNNNIVTLSPVNLSEVIFKDQAGVYPIHNAQRTISTPAQDPSKSTFEALTKNNNILKDPVIANTVSLVDFLSKHNLSSATALHNKCTNIDGQHMGSSNQSASLFQIQSSSMESTKPTNSVSINDLKPHQNYFLASIETSNTDNVPYSKSELRSVVIPKSLPNLFSDIQFSSGDINQPNIFYSGLLNNTSPSEVINNPINNFSPFNQINSGDSCNYFSRQQSASSDPTYEYFNKVTHLTPEMLSPLISYTPPLLYTDTLNLNTLSNLNLTSSPKINPLETKLLKSFTDNTSSSACENILQSHTPRIYPPYKFIPSFNLTSPPIKSPSFLTKPAIKRFHTWLSSNKATLAVPLSVEQSSEGLLTTSSVPTALSNNVISITINILPHETTSDIVIVI